MAYEESEKGDITPIMRQEKAFTDALAELQALGVMPEDLPEAGIDVGGELTGETESGVRWKLTHEREDSYSVTTEEPLGEQKRAA